MKNKILYTSADIFKELYEYSDIETISTSSVFNHIIDNKELYKSTLNSISAWGDVYCHQKQRNGFSNIIDFGRLDLFEKLLPVLDLNSLAVSDDTLLSYLIRDNRKKEVNIIFDYIAADNIPYVDWSGGKREFSSVDSYITGLNRVDYRLIKTLTRDNIDYTIEHLIKCEQQHWGKMKWDAMDVVISNISKDGMPSFVRKVKEKCSFLEVSKINNDFIQLINIMNVKELKDTSIFNSSQSAFIIEYEDKMDVMLKILKEKKLIQDDLKLLSDTVKSSVFRV